MSVTDLSEWILLDTDLTTRLAILPTSKSHLYLEISEPGSGELKIPLNSTAAGLVTSGMFLQCNYRGSSRGGMFVDNVSEFEADRTEGGGRWMSISGRGAMALLDDAVIWDDGTAATTRTFTGTKAGILKTLIDEAQARGALVAMTYDFTASVDSNSISWTDSESYSLNVGMSLFDLMRQFAEGGIDFDMNLVAGTFVLSAYKNGMGTDKSETIYFRVGSNCIEVKTDEKGDNLKNTYRVAWQDGYLTVSDSTSITNHRRREKLLDIKQAQTSVSATTYSAAVLSDTKEPQVSISVQIYDGVSPRLFEDYDMGDYIMLDVFGVERKYRILGIQADFDGVNYSNVVVELNTILRTRNLQTTRDLNWLMNQWNTAHDSNLLETRYWAAIGNPNDLVTQINAIALIGNELYFGGSVTKLGGVNAFNFSAYNVKTGKWRTTNNAPSLFIDINCFAVKGTDLYIGGYYDDMYKYNTLTDTFTNIGTARLGEAFTATINAMQIIGDDLYITGRFDNVDGDYVTDNIVRYNTVAGTWHDVGATGLNLAGYALAAIGSTLYIGGDFTTAGGAAASKVASWNGTAYSALDVGLDNDVYALAVTGTNIIAGGLFTDHIAEWDGSAWTVLDGGVHGNVRGLAVYLTDIYAIGEFTNAGGVSANKIARNSGGSWAALEGGLNNTGYAIALYDSSVYVGGVFTQAGDKDVVKVAAYFNNFASLLEYLENSSVNGFDMGAAIHNATASAITDSDEVPFWEDVSNALRKITWANIKATLKTYFDALYVPFSQQVDTKDPTGWVTPDTITTSYNSTTRTITLSGTLDYYWRGKKYSLTSPWTSVAHANIVGSYFLYSTNGTDFLWSTDVWMYYELMVAKVAFQTSDKWGLRETHGLMPWQVHEELHETVSAFRESGGGLTAGTYAENTATDAANSPGFDAAQVQDEDLHSTIPAWIQGTYTTMLIGASQVATFDTTATLPFRHGANYIYFNTPSTGAETAAANNRYLNVYQILVPTTADTDSQKYRTLILQPQTQYTTLVAAQAEDPRVLVLGDLTTTAPEFVIYARITYVTASGDGNNGKCRIATGGITYLAGTKLSQVSVSGFVSPTAENIPFTPAGTIAATNVQAAIEEVAAEAGGGGTPGGSNTQVQFNDGGAFGGDAGFTFDKTLNAVTLGDIDATIAKTDAAIIQGANAVSVANVLETFGTGVASFITFLRGRGTNAAPTAVQAEDIIGRIRGRAYDANNNPANTSTEITLVANQTHSSTAHGTRVEIYTTPDGSTTLTKALTVQADGNVNIETGKTYNINGSPHTHAMGLTLISDLYLASDTASFDFTSIPSTYKHLKIYLQCRSNLANVEDGVVLRLNNNTGNSYVGLIQWVSTSNVPARYLQTTAGAPFSVAYCAANNSTAGYMSNSEMTLFSSADGNSYTTFQARGFDHQASGGGAYVYDAGGQYLSNTAISRITLLPAAGTNFKQYSRATLYGLG